jgi:bisphosphoglycerate-dependent phosphoglycerate mutase
MPKINDIRAIEILDSRRYGGEELAEAQAVAQLLRSEGLEFDVAFTSMLRRAN